MAVKHFETSVYMTQYDLNNIKDFQLFRQEATNLIETGKLTKVYIETYRNGIFVEEETIVKVKEFYKSKGIKVEGGITLTSGIEHPIKNMFMPFCYGTQTARDLVEKVVSYTSRLFDAYVIDDFYFNNCKCDRCIEKKEALGLSWSEYRLQLMADIAKNIIIKKSKEVNPNVKVILKYPNWYDHYHNVGYNLELSDLFDGIYSGTETRDPVHTQQNIQRYTSYFIMRYLENIKPNHNLGGWFDTLECSYSLNSVVEQANLTLFSKAKESTTYSYGALVGQDRIFVPLLGYVYEQFDKISSELGNPIGIATYRPFNSEGEDFLHGHIGMLGIPLEPTPYFPMEEKTIFLTASAAKDDAIILKIKKALSKGHQLILTSGLVKALEARGIREVINVAVLEQKAQVTEFGIDWEICAYKYYDYATKPIVLSKLTFGTNESKNTIAGLVDEESYPLLIESNYSKGTVHVLNIPEHFAQMKNLPKQALTVIRKLFLRNMPIKIDGDGIYGTFIYNNDAIIIHSFDSKVSHITIEVHDLTCELLELENKRMIKGKVVNKNLIFEVEILAGYYKAYKIIKNSK